MGSYFSMHLCHCPCNAVAVQCKHITVTAGFPAPALKRPWIYTQQVLVCENKKKALEMFWIQLESIKRLMEVD